MKRARSVCGILLLVCLFVAACKPTDVPNAAAPSSHTWAAEPVLISLFTATNFTHTYFYEWSKLPDLVVYADGRVLLAREEPKRVVYEAHLQSADLCSLLQQITADGFWDLQQKDYKAADYADLYTIWIDVNAWRRQEVSAYGLDSDYLVTPMPPALKSTYIHLRDYMPSNLQPFQPDKLVVSVLEQDQQPTGVEWPLQTPSLADLHSREKGNWSGAVIDGQEASDIYKLFAGDFSRPYKENGKIYQLTIRPLLPFEVWEANRNQTLPPKFQQTPTSELKCSAD
jgi:hypothetical protein